MPQQTVVVRVTEGEVFIKYPPGKAPPSVRGAHARQAPTGFVPLKGAASIPLGSTVDTTRGTLAMTSAANRAGRTQTGTFYAGIFATKQRLAARAKPKARTAALTTELIVKGASPSTCGGTRAAGTARKKRKVLGTLWGDAKGNFRTVGRSSSPRPSAAPVAHPGPLRRHAHEGPARRRIGARLQGAPHGHRARGAQLSRPRPARGGEAQEERVALFSGKCRIRRDSSWTSNGSIHAQ